MTVPFMQASFIVDLISDWQAFPVGLEFEIVRLLVEKRTRGNKKGLEAAYLLGLSKYGS
jgi:hypothetical protein